MPVPLLETKLGGYIDNFLTSSLEDAFDEYGLICSFATEEYGKKVEDEINKGGSAVVAPFFEPLNYDFILAPEYFKRCGYRARPENFHLRSAFVQLKEVLTWQQKEESDKRSSKDDGNEYWEESDLVSDLDWLIQALEYAQNSKLYEITH
jgi:hypothetical protein